MEHRHPLYPRIVFTCATTHPAVRPQAEQRRPAYDALRQGLRASGYYATANEEKGDVWIEALGKWVPFWEAKRLTEERIRP
jgi:hypothetical protein